MVYGSLTTAIVVLLSLEIAATLLLLGAQVISEFERIDRPAAPRPGQSRGREARQREALIAHHDAFAARIGTAEIAASRLLDGLHAAGQGHLAHLGPAAGAGPAPWQLESARLPAGWGR